MALSPQVVNAIVEVALQLDKGSKVLALGYPDVLVDIKELETKFNLVGLEEHKDSKSMGAYHGYPNIKIPTAESFFKSLGLELSVLDIKEWRGGELVGDLNYPLPDNWTKDFSLVIDLGTCEHCFNVAMAMENILNQVKEDGYIIHFNPMNMQNHGFYNFSPTFYHDWYLANGGSVQHQSAWVKKEKEETMVIVPKTERFGLGEANISLLTIVRKIETLDKITYPFQTKYANMDKMGA